jgi:hypothetical protein
MASFPPKLEGAVVASLPAIQGVTIEVRCRREPI